MLHLTSFELPHNEVNGIVKIQFLDHQAKERSPVIGSDGELYTVDENWDESIPPLLTKVF